MTSLWRCGAPGGSTEASSYHNIPGPEPGHVTMDDREFLEQLKTKIERLTGTQIELELDSDDRSTLTVDLERPLPRVELGANILEYAGFARMAVEYVVASIREKRELGPLEFQILLARN
jgi:hypothetical protein